MPTIPSSLATTRRLWRVAQLIGVAATVVLVAGLILLPKVTLTVMWSILIPLLPASFLVSPAIWRNVCPLATLNLATNRRSAPRTVPRIFTNRAGMLGVALLVVLVPARRFIFNADAVALAVVIGVVAGLALVMGVILPLKSGFCNAMCPVLPVERLYGHRPLVRMDNPRCVPCTTCTSGGCIDLAPVKSIAHTLGRARGSHDWLTTWYGAFAASFPGFVVGYFTVPDGPLGTAGQVYLHVALWAGVSYVITAVLVGLLNARSEQALLALAALAAGLYYWYAVDATATVFAFPALFVAALRTLFIALVAVWWWRSVTSASGRARQSPMVVQ